LDGLYPDWTTWFGLFARLTERVAERFKLDARPVRNVTWREGRAHLAHLLDSATIPTTGH
jgi:hypothetical protein